MVGVHSEGLLRTAGHPRAVALNLGCILELSGELLKFPMSRLQVSQNLWAWDPGISTF